jgi:F-type H+-transporting ATPase subunit gamma
MGAQWMKREQHLQRRLHTLQALNEAVSAMKSLSAHHFLRCRQALSPARTYRDEIEQAMADIGVAQAVDGEAPPGLVLVVSDLGLCGDYNTQLVQAAEVAYRKREPGPIYCIGRRPRAALARAALQPQRTYHVSASVEGLPDLLLEVAQDLLDDYIQQKMSCLDVVSARFEGAGRFSPVLTRVLPVESVRAATPVRPTPYESADHLATVAIREYLYTTLYDILLDALASEHGMRLVAAESARQWIEETSDAVRRQIAASRREATTQEVMDIVAGTRTRRR